MASDYRFSFGPWNISEGGDPFGPTVRPTVAFADKLALYKKLGFDGVQFHDDDAVPDIENKSPAQILREAKEMKKVLSGEGLTVEIFAPRLWEDARGIDGGFTANDPKVRKWAIERSKKSIDVGHALGCNLMILWLAREGTYIREAKSSIDATKRLVETVNILLDYSKKVQIAIEPKPNEPMDHAYLPTIGHALALGMQTKDPKRVGALIEVAHSLLAGLDASDDMGFALAANKLWSVHLNDQNGLKYDQDKSFGSSNLRAAWNIIRVLEEGGYPKSGRYVGLDVKAMRTQKADVAHKHLSNSRAIFLALVEKVRTWDKKFEKECIANRDYEELELGVMKHLMGI